MIRLILPIILFFLVVLTPIADAKSNFRTLKIVNNNVYLFEGGKKLDKLTTRGNSSTYRTICKKYSTRNPCVKYKVINKDKFSLVIKHWWLPDTDSGGTSVFLYNNSEEVSPELVDISYELFWTNRFNSPDVQLKNGKIVISAIVGSDIGLSPDEAEELWFELWDNSGSEEYPLYMKATKTIDDSFFIRMIE